MAIACPEDTSPLWGDIFYLNALSELPIMLTQWGKVKYAHLLYFTPVAMLQELGLNFGYMEGGQAVLGTSDSNVIEEVLVKQRKNFLARKVEFLMHYAGWFLQSSPFSCLR